MSTNGRYSPQLGAQFRDLDLDVHEAALRQQDIEQYDLVAQETLKVLERTARTALGPVVSVLTRHRCYVSMKKQQGGGEIMTVKGMSVPMGEVSYQAPKFTLNLWIPKDGFHPFAPYTPVKISLAEQLIFPTGKFKWQVQYKVKPHLSEVIPDLWVDTDFDLFDCPSGDTAMLERVRELVCERSKRLERVLASRGGMQGGPAAPGLL